MESTEARPLWVAAIPKQNADTAPLAMLQALVGMRDVPIQGNLTLSCENLGQSWRVTLRRLEPTSGERSSAQSAPT